MSHVEQPAPTGLAALVHERDGLVDARIRLHAGVKPGVEIFKLRYYFEIIENEATA